MNQTLKNKLRLTSSCGAVAMAMVLIHFFEGIKYEPYYDVGGVLTVCYGHTGPDIVKNKIYTQSECDKLLDFDLKKVKQQIDPLIIMAIPETMRGALYSFTYNVGVDAFEKSTLLKYINTRQRYKACSELKRWIYAGGKPWKGLMTRREIEEIVCKSDVTIL